MKICERCGHENWEVGEKCEGCDKKFNQSSQCNPMVGGTDRVRDGDGNLSLSTHIHKIIDSDDL